MKSVMEEPEIRVSKDYSQLIASLDHNFVSGRTGRGSNVGHTTLGGEDKRPTLKIQPHAKTCQNQPLPLPDLVKRIS